MGAYVLDTQLHVEEEYDVNATILQLNGTGIEGSALTTMSTTSDDHEYDTDASTPLGLDAVGGEILLWSTSIIGSVFGGLGAGLIWSAQGYVYSRTSLSA